MRTMRTIPQEEGRKAIQVQDDRVRDPEDSEGREAITQEVLEVPIKEGQEEDTPQRPADATRVAMEEDPAVLEEDPEATSLEEEGRQLHTAIFPPPSKPTSN